MEDITPRLIQQVTEEFRRLYAASGHVQELLEKVKQKTATYAEAQQYAIEVSRLIGNAYEKYISSATLPDGKMYYNIANRLLPETLDENHKLVSQYAADVQAALNKKANIGLKVQTAELDQDRVDGLVELAANADQYDDVSGKLISAFENFNQHIVDETIRRNAEFQYNSGMRPKIYRKAESKCCKWCRALAGEYDYPDVPDDIYRRHENCRCTVEYDPADGKKKRQNVHTREWTASEETVKMETRKVIGIRINGTTVQSVNQHVFNRMLERSVAMDSILDALSDPLEIKPVKIDQFGRPSFVVIGRKATVAINPNTGEIVTTHPTHTKTADKLLRKKGTK